VSFVDILILEKIFTLKVDFRRMYVLRVARRRTCVKFHQDSFKTERLVYLETDGQTDGQGYIDSARRPDHSYGSFMI